MKKHVPERLSAEQAALMREVLQNQSPSRLDALLPRAIENTLDRAEREELCLLIAREFMQSGLDADDEPLPRGLQLEELLDVINRPNLLSE